MPRDATSSGSRSDKEIGAVPRLDGRWGDRAAARYALVRRKLRAVLDGVHQQNKGVLCMRLDQLELREGVLVGLDVVAVLHLVETVCRAPMLPVVAVVIPVGDGGGHGARICAGVEVDRQQRIHCTGN